MSTLICSWDPTLCIHHPRIRIVQNYLSTLSLHASVTSTGTYVPLRCPYSLRDVVIVFV